MELRESETTEFKRIYVEDIRKEIIAMANTAGGTVYIGVEDDSAIAGLDDPDDTILRISNGMRDAVKPDITMFLHYETLDFEGKQVVAVRVQRGTARPYYLAAKGLRPEGVYVRQGSSSVPASDAAIRSMIKETDGDNYENMRSLNQSLTFQQAAAFFADRSLEFGMPQMQTLGLVGINGIYTNLGLLLSDQCPHIIKAATFSGTDQQKFQDRREFTGSLLRQLNDAYNYLDLRNQKAATFEGLYRTDRMDYPETALREALLNAIVHRDYAFSASTLVSVYLDRIEMVSIGGLVQGVSLDDVMMGLSVCRNQKLANVFYRLELIEAYGTGMQKIRTAYQGSGKKPDIQTTGNAFKITLPNLNHGADGPDLAKKRPNEVAAVLEWVHAKGSITRQQVEELLNVKTATAVRLLRQMVDENYITTVGRGRNTRYVPR